MGYALRIPWVKFGINNDDILTEGSLVLVEPGDVNNGWSGIPSNGATVPNLAGEFASSVVGSDVSTLTFERTMVGDEGIVERSAKGGLHVAENYGNGVSNHVVILNILSAMRSYLDENTGHDLYMCTWGRFTRMADPSLAQVLHASITGTNGTRVGVGHVPSSGVLSGSPSSSDARRRGFRADTDNGNAYQAIAANGVPATGFSTPHMSPILSLGPRGAGQVGKSAGYLLWWLYVEDLTVSGRSFADVDALVHGYYTQQVLTPAGRYYGDSYTTPN